MRFNCNIFILMGLVISVSTDEQFTRQQRRNLLKTHTQNDAISNYEQNVQSNHLIGFVPVISPKGDIYLVPQHTIKVLQNEYSAKIGQQDGTILVPDQVIKVTAGNTKTHSETNNHEINYLIVPNVEIKNIDPNNIIDYNDVSSDNSNLIGRQAVIVRHRYRGGRRRPNRRINRGNRNGGVVLRRRYRRKGGANRIIGGRRRGNGVVLRRRYIHRGGQRRINGGRRRNGVVLRRVYTRRGGGNRIIGGRGGNGVVLRRRYTRRGGGGRGRRNSSPTLFVPGRGTNSRRRMLLRG